MGEVNVTIADGTVLRPGDTVLIIAANHKHFDRLAKRLQEALAVRGIYAVVVSSDVNVEVIKREED